MPHAAADTSPRPPGPPGRGRAKGRLGPVALVGALGLVAGACSATHARPPATVAAPRQAGAGPSTTAAAPAVQARLAPWRLAAPIAREVVLAQGHSLIVLGGVDGADQSVAGVFRLDPANGALSTLGTLPDAAHDAAGAILGGRDVVFAGGNATPVATVQAWSSSSGGQVLGQLPQARSDLVAATVGGTTYLLGGYDGSSLVPAVLATTDGSRFHPVANLPVPVRYPAVAALGSRIFLFGGESGGGLVDAIQEVDVATGTARVIGHLPRALGDAAAAALGGRLYVMGGRVAAGMTNQVWSVDPASGQARPAGTLPEALANEGVATIGDRAYLVGGEDPSPTSSVVVVQPG